LARLEGSKSAYIPVNRKAIVDRRKHLHLTQVQLAERCGLSDSTISAIETGRAARINDTTAEALERGLQADRARFTYPLAPDLVAIQGSGTKAGSNGALPHGTSDTEILRELFRSFVKLCAQAKVALDWQDGGADAGTMNLDEELLTDATIKDLVGGGRSLGPHAIRIKAEDRPGLLRDLLRPFASKELSLPAVQARVHGKAAVITLVPPTLFDANEWQRIADSLKSTVPGVESVTVGERVLSPYIQPVSPPTTPDANQAATKQAG
jgi:transcriptional regulator with XRE-family HTH domain